MLSLIDFDRLEHDRPDDAAYTPEEIENGIATVAAILTLAAPFSGRGVIFREAAQLVERVTKR